MTRLYYVRKPPPAKVNPAVHNLGGIERITPGNRGVWGNLALEPNPAKADVFLTLGG
jgi:hypothetical protein